MVMQRMTTAADTEQKVIFTDAEHPNWDVEFSIMHDDGGMCWILPSTDVGVAISRADAAALADWLIEQLS